VSFALCMELNSSQPAPLTVFSAEGVEEQLGVAATKYCNDRVEIEQGLVRLPQLFEWYHADFGSTDRELLSFVCRQLTGPKQKALMSAIKGGRVPEVQYR